MSAPTAQNSTSQDNAKIQMRNAAIAILGAASAFGFAAPAVAGSTATAQANAGGGNESNATSTIQDLGPYHPSKHPHRRAARKREAEPATPGHQRIVRYRVIGGHLVKEVVEANAAAVAAPAPAPVEVPPPPPPPPPPSLMEQLGLHWKVFAGDQPIELPMGDVPQSDVYKVFHKSGCNQNGLWEAIRHPINANCQYYQANVSTTIVGVLGVNQNDQTVFVVTNPTAITHTASWRADRGEGWLDGFYKVGMLALQGWAVSIAQDALNASSNLDASIVAGHVKIGSLFAGGCADQNVVGAGNGNTTVGGGAAGMSAVCAINSPMIDSGTGVGNNVQPTSPTTTLTASYVPSSPAP